MKRINLLLLLIVLLGTFLRFYQVQNDPPGLYIDEAAIGYNAYTILKSGKDEYSTAFPLFFRSFGDYKGSVYIYSVSGAMAIFGKNEFAVRFPSAFAGTLTVVVFYFFLKKIIDLDKNKIDPDIKKYLPIVSTFLLSISSWHIQFSRGGFEVTLALFLYLLGSYLALLFWENKNIFYLLFCFILFDTTMYTYQTFKVISPLTWFIIILFLLIKLPKFKKQIIIAGIVFLLLFIPIVKFSLTQEGSSRFMQTSAFVEYTVRTPQEKIFVYPMVYAKNYLSFFSFDFLFSNGDGNGRHQIPGFGLLYRWQFIFFIIGVYVIIKQKKSLFKFITITLMLMSPIPAALARPSPHSLRPLLLTFLSVIIAIGLIATAKKLVRFRKAFIIVISVVAVYEFSVYLHFYYFHYPNVNSLDWGAGYKELVIKAAADKNKYDYLVVDKSLSFAPIYFHFYDDSLKPIFVNPNWDKPKNWSNKRILYIRPFYGRSDPRIIDQSYLPGINKKIFAQFWKV